ncbi:Regulatory protein BlaR1 [compost metagenome]
MPHLFIILLKINLVLLLFAATYHLVLRRLTFYVLNRCFLAFGIVFSTAYPFIDLTEFFQQEASNAVVTYLPQLNQKASEMVPTGFFINNWPILSALFYFGVLLMTIRLAIQFTSLYMIHRKSNPDTVANYKVRTLNESVSPFSFWQTIYVNPSLHSEKELYTILAHETVHVKQWHSVDIILAELSVVFYWFNPGVWMMKKAVKENLEFITDQKILKKGMDKKAYQYSLLGVGQLKTSVAIVNNFNLSDLKKRIQMMNVKRSSRLTLSRYALALPVLLLTTLAFTVSKKEVKASLPQLAKVIPQLTVMQEKAVDTAKIKTKLLKPSKNKKQNAVIGADTGLVNSNVIFVKRDSAVGIPSIGEVQQIMAAVKNKLNPGASGKPANATLGRVFFYRKDSVNLGKVEEANKMALKFRVEGKPADDEDLFQKGDKKPVVKVFKIGDTLLNQNVEYLIDGKVSFVNDIKDLNPNEIRSINVIKRVEGKSQIHIEMKRKSEL